MIGSTGRGFCAAQFIQGVSILNIFGTASNSIAGSLCLFDVENLF